MVRTVATSERDRADHFLFRNASWRLYRSIVDEVGDGNVRVTYDGENLEIMSPLPEHERGKKHIGRMIEMLTFDRNIACASLGSTTYSDERLAKGLEPDECYYFANEARIRGKKRIDLQVDPPPDLVVEIDISYRAIRRESIYAALKVPEVWRYDGMTLACLVLDDREAYRESEFSPSFPFLRVAELTRFIDMAATEGENAMMRAFREWAATLP